MKQPSTHSSVCVAYGARRDVMSYANIGQTFLICYLCNSIRTPLSNTVCYWQDVRGLPWGFIKIYVFDIARHGCAVIDVVALFGYLCDIILNLSLPSFTDLKILTLLLILQVIMQYKCITHTTQNYYNFSPHDKMFLSKVFLGHGYYSGRPTHARYGYPPEPVSLSQCLLAQRGSGGRGGEESGPLIVMTSLFIDLHFISLLCFSGEISSRGRGYKSIYFSCTVCVCCFVYAHLLLCGRSTAFKTYRVTFIVMQNIYFVSL